MVDHESCWEKQGHLKIIPDPNSWDSINGETAITEMPIKITKCPGKCDSVVRDSAHRLKGGGFESQSRAHILVAGSVLGPSWGTSSRKQIDMSLSRPSLSLFSSLPPSPFH